MKALLVALLVCVSSILFYFWIGIEVIGREHDSDYDFFVKKHATSKMFFENPVLCGECDFRPYEKISIESQQDFKNLCYIRYDLTDVTQCEKLFQY